MKKLLSEDYPSYVCLFQSINSLRNYVSLDKDNMLHMQYSANHTERVDFSSFTTYVPLFLFYLECLSLDRDHSRSNYFLNLTKLKRFVPNHVPTH